MFVVEITVYCTACQVSSLSRKRVEQGLISVTSLSEVVRHVKAAERERAGKKKPGGF